MSRPGAVVLASVIITGTWEAVRWLGLWARGDVGAWLVVLAVLVGAVLVFRCPHASMYLERGEPGRYASRTAKDRLMLVCEDCGKRKPVGVDGKRVAAATAPQEAVVAAERQA